MGRLLGSQRRLAQQKNKNEKNENDSKYKEEKSKGIVLEGAFRGRKALHQNWENQDMLNISKNVTDL